MQGSRGKIQCRPEAKDRVEQHLILGGTRAEVYWKWVEGGKRSETSYIGGIASTSHAKGRRVPDLRGYHTKRTVEVVGALFCASV